jgi:hypothetical protein
MKKLIILCLIMHIWASANSAAETVSVPLPTILGRYYADFPSLYYRRSAHYMLDRIPLSVSGVWIHISGSFLVGETRCPPPGPGDGESFPQGIEYYAAFVDTTSLWYPDAAALSPTQSGSFEYTLPFSRPAMEVNWEFLKTGHGDLEMQIAFMMIPECSILLWPEATIDHAELLIEGQFPVAVDQGTWGSIKALFR